MGVEAAPGETDIEIEEIETGNIPVGKVGPIIGGPTLLGREVIGRGERSIGETEGQLFEEGQKIARVIRGILEQKGYTLREFASGEKGQERKNPLYRGRDIIKNGDSIIIQRMKGSGGEPILNIEHEFKGPSGKDNKFGLYIGEEDNTLLTHIMREGVTIPNYINAPQNKKLLGRSSKKPAAANIEAKVLLDRVITKLPNFNEGKITRKLP